jgi:arsenate reductase
MDADSERQRIIFVCTHNSARSQMAEGMLRAWGGDRFEVFSAGTEATRVRPEAIAVMAEIGIDISRHTSKTLEPFLHQSFSWLVTVCDDAKEACPTLPGVRRQAHWSIEDPSGVEGDEGARLEAFRAARDELGDRIRKFLADRG